MTSDQVTLALVLGNIGGTLIATYFSKRNKDELTKQTNNVSPQLAAKRLRQGRDPDATLREVVEEVIDNVTTMRDEQSERIERAVKRAHTHTLRDIKQMLEERNSD